MKKISTTLITAILSIIIVVTFMMSICTAAVVRNQVSQDVQTYLETYSQQVANEVNNTFASYESVALTMAQQLRSTYETDRITDNIYNQEMLEQLKPFVLSINEEFSELLSVAIALNTNYTKELYCAWSSNGELVDYSLPEDTASIHAIITSLNDAVSDGKAKWGAPYYDDVIEAHCMT